MFVDAVMLPLAGRKPLRSGVCYLVVLILSHSGRDGRCPLRRVGLRRKLQPPSIFSTAPRIVLPAFLGKSKSRAFSAGRYSSLARTCRGRQLIKHREPAAEKGGKGSQKEY